MLGLWFRKSMKRMGAIAPTNYLRVLMFRLAGYEIGQSVWIGPRLLIVDDNFGNEKLVIEDRVALAPRVTIILQSYPNNSRLRDVIPARNGDVVIGADSWVGAGAIILPDITIGRESVVGAGSIVTKDVGDEMIVAGSPAKYLRSINSDVLIDAVELSDEVLGLSDEVLGLSDEVRG